MITVSPGAAPAHGAGRPGESGNWQNREEQQVQGLELPWRTAEQDFWKVEEINAGYLANRQSTCLPGSRQVCRNAAPLSQCAKCCEPGRRNRAGF